MAEASQEELLEVAAQTIRKCGFSIRQYLREDDTSGALDEATEMVDQLRLNIHSPRSYYNIYISVTDELRKLEAYLTDEFKRGQRIDHLYETVQYNQFVLPRLYMMITIGTVYLKANVLPTGELLRDMTEMCRGIQHPMRGLFIRNYLLHAVKNVVCQCGEPSASTDDSMDAVDFILTNFCEMNKLWVRMQHQGHSKEMAKREQERKELQLLVGTNILRLSQLEDLTVEMYTKRILPVLSEQLISCRDSLAQEYIFDCIVQAFPDNFHISTFETLMGSLLKLHSSHGVDKLMSTLTERLAEYSYSEEGSKLFVETGMVERCTQHTENIITSGTCVSRDEVVGLYSCVLKLSLTGNIQRSEKLSTASKTCAAVESYLEEAKSTQISAKSPLGAQVLQFLRLMISPPVAKAANELCSVSMLELLQMSSFFYLMSRLEKSGQCEISVAVLNSLSALSIKLDTSDKVRLVLNLLGPLLEYPWIGGQNAKSVSDQQLLGSFPHCCDLSGEPEDKEIEVFIEIVTKFESGGTRQLIYRLPSLISAVYQAVARRQKATDSFYERMLMDIAYSIISNLLSNEYIEVSLDLLVQGALVCSFVRFSRSESIAYEFITQAFSLFEDGITESHKQISALTLIYGAVQKMHCFNRSEGTGPNLRKRLVQGSMLLMKRPDQCRMLCVGSHLHWAIKDADIDTMEFDYEGAFHCLRKARKIAGKCIDHVTHAQLLLDIADQYIYFAEDENADIPEESMPISTLQEIINSTRCLLESSRHQDLKDLLMERRKRMLLHMKANRRKIFDKITDSIA